MLYRNKRASFCYLWVMDYRMIETSRLRLRPLTGAKWREILLKWPAPDALSFLGVDPLTYEKDKRKAEGGFESFNKKLLLFHLIDRTTDEVIGWCGYHTWYIDHGRAEIGYVMTSEAHRKRGLMGEALEAVLAFGFSDLQLHRVEAMTATYNDTSNRLLAKFGFRFEGLLREHYLVGDRHEDSQLFSLLASEWKEARG
jgi:[ribosomal protein S5]-alanine N-acetyltransferase